MKYSIELVRLTAVVLITFTHTQHHFTEGTTHFILEEIPKYGTLLLSLISGFLWQTISRLQPKLFQRKIKSLVIPYLIANLIVLIPVAITFFAFDYNFLNRLDFDYTLITDGVFALNKAPINPPTYFIRDIFMVFVFLELLLNKNFRMLLILIPFAVFGKIFLRVDIVVLFLLGAFSPFIFQKIKKKYWILSAQVLLSAGLFFIFPDYFKYGIAFLIFLFVINIDIKFIKTGNYTYLLHLYHSPVMVATFPVINHFVKSPYPNVILQLSFAFASALILTYVLQKIPLLRFLSGGR